MKTYLIRHGQTTSDVEDRYGGDYDDHLTELGEIQARQLAGQLEGKGIEVIFASDKIRAQETAKILSQKLGAPILIDANLRERNLYANLTGMKKSEAKQKYPDLVKRIKNTEDTIEGAEFARDFVERVVDSFNKISQLDYKTVAIVTHGGTIRRILWEVFGIKKEQSDIQIGDCAYLEVETETIPPQVINMVGVEIIH